LTDDFYRFDSTRSQLVGGRTRRVVKLGDKLEVQVAKVDSFKRQVDFGLARDVTPPGRRHSIPQTGGGRFRAGG
jgi:ribonuclease R